jgi:hypothetical protein
MLVAFDAYPVLAAGIEMELALAQNNRIVRCGFDLRLCSGC